MLAPLADNVIIEPIRKERYGDTLVIPDRYKEQPTRGRVIAVGSMRTLDSGTQVPMTLRVGDEVVFHKHGAEPIVDEDGREWLLANEADVLAVVETER